MIIYSQSFTCTGTPFLKGLISKYMYIVTMETIPVSLVTKLNTVYMILQNKTKENNIVRCHKLKNKQSCVPASLLKTLFSKDTSTKLVRPVSSTFCHDTITSIHEVQERFQRNCRINSNFTVKRIFYNKTKHWILQILKSYKKCT